MSISSSKQDMDRFMLQFIHDRGYYISPPDINLLNGEVSLSVLDKKSEKVAEVTAHLMDHHFELYNFDSEDNDPFIMYTVDSSTITFKYPEKEGLKDDHKFLPITWVLDRVAIMDEEVHDILSAIIDYGDMSQVIKQQIAKLPDEALNPDYYLITEENKKSENQKIFSVLLEREHTQKLDVNIQVDRSWSKRTI